MYTYNLDDGLRKWKALFERKKNERERERERERETERDRDRERERERERKRERERESRERTALCSLLFALRFLRSVLLLIYHVCNNACV